MNIKRRDCLKTKTTAVIKGEKWALEILTQKAFEKKHGTESRAMTVLDKRLIEFNAELSLGVLAHELLHIRRGDLRTGDVLITEEGSMASVTGHAAVVLEAEGDVIRVLSADQRGAYIETNIDPAVGGRQWDVFRPGIADMNAMLNRAEMMATRGELRQYLGNFGGNVCSSCVASAVEAGGGPVAPRFVLNLVIPATLRETYGPPIGRVFVPRLENI